MPNYVVNGTLTLGEHPVSPSQAATKGYVDGKVTAIDASHVGGVAALPAARMPALSGELVATQGTTALTLTSSGVVPGSYTKVRTDANGRIVEGISNVVGDYTQHVSFNNILPVSRPNSLVGYGITDGVRTDGATMLGMVGLSASSFSGAELVNKEYVDSTLTAAMDGKTIATGDVIVRPSTSTPIGYFRCNGGMVNKMAYPALYAVIGDGGIPSITDYGYGKPWAQQSAINTTQSGALTDGFASVNQIPANKTGACVVVTVNKVYLLGGASGDTAVYTATINTDGTIGAWAATTPMPSAVYAADAVVIKDRIHVIGGAGLTTVYTTTIGDDGALGAWTTGTSLPTIIQEGHAFVCKNKVYLLGGRVGSTPTASTSVYVCAINEDNTLGTWAMHPSTLPNALVEGDLAVIGDRVYIFGGVGAVNTVHYATLGNDGSLGSVWTAVTALPSTWRLGKAYVSAGTVYLIGGYHDAGASAVMYAPINADNSIGTWASLTAVPTTTLGIVVFATKNHLYMGTGAIGPGNSGREIYSAPILGGLNDYSEYYAVPGESILNTGKPWAQQYEINKDQSAALTGWSAGTSLPASLKGAQAVITENRAYLIGGTNGTTASSAVYTAPINTDGSIGTWATSVALPQAVCDAQAVVLKDKIFVIGGSNGTTQSAKVYTAVIAIDGTISSWVAVADLPETFSRGQAVATGTRLYIFGGLFSGSRSNKSYYTEVASDGALGGWMAAGVLPVTLADAKVLVAKRNLYLIGGTSAAGVLKTHCRASILPDGSLSAWVNLMTPTTVNLYGSNSSAFPVNVGSAKLIGKGGDGGNATTVSLSGTGSGVLPVGTTAIAITGKGADVDLVPGYTVSHGRPWEQQYDINTTDQSTGTFGGFVAAQGIPTMMTGEAIVTKNRVYLFGTSETAAVWTAPINSDGSIGTWSITTPLPEVMQYATAVAIKNKIYVFGGLLSNVNFAYSAAINSDGTLGGWTAYTDGPSRLVMTTAAVIKNRLYLFGGANGTNNDTYVHYSTINSDGTLGAWFGTSSLPRDTKMTRVIVTSSYVYLLAGTYNGATTNEVFVASISSDGSLSSWSSYSTLPSVTGYGRIYVTKTKAYLIGGVGGGGVATTNTILAASISETGVLGTWSTSGTIPAALANFAMVATAGKLHILGGNNTTGNSVYTGYSATINGGANDYSQYYDGTQIALNQPVTTQTELGIDVGYGRPWEQQNNIAFSQTTLLNNWTAQNDLSHIQTVHGAFVAKGRIYVIGFFTGYPQTYSHIQSAPINADGTIGAWVNLGSMTSIMVQFGVIVTRNHVHLIGGWYGDMYSSSQTNQIQTATINADGTLSAWTASPPIPVSGVVRKALIIKNRVYAFSEDPSTPYIGGAFYIATVMASAPINADGTLGSWAGGVEVVSRHGLSVIATKTRLYLIGGRDLGNNRYADILSYTIGEDGALSALSTETPLPDILSDAAVYVNQGRAYLISGSYGAGATTTNILSAQVNEDGTISGWSITGTLPYGLTAAEAIVTKNKIHLIGNGTNNHYTANTSDGMNNYEAYTDGVSTVTIPARVLSKSIGYGRPWVQQNKINKTQSSQLGNWSSSLTAPAAIVSGEVFVTKNVAYLVGGQSDPGTGTTQNVYSATINADGSFGSWLPRNAIPSKLRNFTLFTTKNRVYIVGGHTGTGVTPLSYTATISEIGHISTWSAGPSLPDGIHSAQVIVVGGYVYHFGGTNASGEVDAVYRAVVNADGTIGSWNFHSQLPATLTASAVVSTGNKLHLIGGYNAATGHRTIVYTCTVSTAGDISAWSTGTSLTTGTSQARAYITSSKVYLIGGQMSTGMIQSADVYADGTLGSWTAEPTALGNTSIYNSQVFAVNNWLYVIFGHNNGVWSNTTYSAPITGGQNNYQAFIDGVTTSRISSSGTPAFYNTTMTINGVTYTFAAGSTSVPSTLFTHNATLPSSPAATYTYAVANGGTLGLAYQAASTSNNSLTGTGTLNLPASTTTVSMTAKGAAGTSTALVVGAGKPWQQHAGFAASTSSANITGWTTNHMAAPNTYYNSCVAVTKDHVYLMGGTGDGSSCVSTIYKAPATGVTLDNSSQWTSAGNLPIAVMHAEVFTTFNRIYLVGGRVSGMPVSTVYTALIDVNGVIGSWTQAGSLPLNIERCKAVVIKNKVYLIGGWSSGSYLNTVYTATVYQDGTLSSWSTGASLPSAFAQGGVAVTSTRVYVFGGTAGGLTSVVHYAAINTDGTLSGWVTDTNLPQGVAGGETYTTASHVYYFTSASNNGQYGLVYHAPIVNGVIGAWTQGNGRGGNEAETIHVFALQNKLYCISSGMGYTNSISYATITTGNDDYNLMTLSENTTGASSTITLAGTTYTFPGGNGGPAADTTQSVTLPGNAAQLLSYSIQTGATASVNYNYVSSTNGLPTTVTVNGTTYTFPGGTAGPATETSYDITFPTTGASYSNNVSTYGYARLEYETPTSGSALPAPVSDFHTYVTGSTAYVIGGAQAGSPSTSVYTASIDYAGVLSPWTTSTALSTAIASGSLITTKNKIHILGGYTSTGASPAVQTATITGSRNDYSGIYTQAASTAYAAEFKLPDYTSIENPATYYYIKY